MHPCATIMIFSNYLFINDDDDCSLMEIRTYWTTLEEEYAASVCDGGKGEVGRGEEEGFGWNTPPTDCLPSPWVWPPRHRKRACPLPSIFTVFSLKATSWLNRPSATLSWISLLFRVRGPPSILFFWSYSLTPICLCPLMEKGIWVFATLIICLLLSESNGQELGQSLIIERVEGDIGFPILLSCLFCWLHL